MSDYRIVVEVNKRKSGKSASPTTPSEPGVDKPTKPSEPNDGGAKDPSLLQLASAVRNPGQALIKLARNTAVGVAVTVAGKAAMDIASATIDIGATESGDYAMQMVFNNFKSTLSAIGRPIGTAFTYMKKEAEIERVNKRHAMARELMGTADLGGEGTRGA